MYKIVLHIRDERACVITFEDKDIIKQFPDELHVNMSFTDIGNLTIFLNRIKEEILYDD